MSSSVVLTGVGRFVADPELKQLENTCVCEFSLVSDEVRSVKGQKEKVPLFLDFNIWDKAAETVVKYCKKGDQFWYCATPRQEKWVDKATGKNRSKIVFRVDDFRLLSNGRAEAKQEQAPTGDASQSTPF
jgi:single stranded DNA-binding protein